MKKILFIMVILCAASALFGQSLEISFDFVNQSGFASNQFAVWIEDANGNHVRTLYATKFTAQGGWKKREQSIPQWVKQSGLAEMNKSQVDAITGPTPKGGTLRYVWDGKNKSGAAAPQGEYRVFVEATLRSENRVLYSGSIRLGSPSGTQAELKPQYSGSSTAERGMIGQVKLRY
jgi:hypothetical protein